MSNQKTSYPIMYARVGSIMKNGKLFLSDVINGNVTKFKKGGEGFTFMSGRSNYVQSKGMNKGSFGVSGSYGISGIAKVDASVGGYVGHAVASGSKAIKVNYNAFVSSGVEYLSINDLSLKDLIASFSKNPRNKMLEIIDNFNNVLDQINGQDLENIDFSIFEKWMKSVDDFKDNYGDSLVVAVHWGAFGTVSMEMSNADNSQSTNYGAEGNFSYSSIFASASVKATYDGNNSNANANVNVDVSSSYTGESIKPIIEQWRSTVEGKSFAELANVKMLAQVPTLSVPTNIIPKVPAFVKPVEKPAEEEGKIKEKPVTERLNKIKKLDGLKKFSLLSVFQKEKKKKGSPVTKDMTISEFSKAISKPVNTSSLDTLIAKGEAIELDDLTSGAESRSARFMAERSMEVSQEDHFVPLGMLTCRWSELFPWLATGFDNQLDELKGAQDILRWRSMIQDFISLSITYHRTGAIPYYANEMNQIGDSFQSAVETLKGKPPHESYQLNMSRAYESLAPNARKVYQVWLENPVLRKGELGFGFITEFGTAHGIGRASYKDVSQREIKTSEIDFDETNPSAFASFAKFYPLIMPSGKIHALAANKGPLAIKTNSFGIGELIMSMQSKPAELVVHKSGEYLEVKDINGKLYPIPFKAAEGVSWKGSSSIVANLSSFTDLSEAISSLKTQLSGLNRFSLSSDNFENISWSPDIGLSDLKVKTEYLGIVPEQKDLMRLY